MFQLKPLSEQAILAYADSEEEAQAFGAAVRTANPGWLIDVVPAYASVAVFFDLEEIDISTVCGQLNGLAKAATVSGASNLVPRFHRIPCCYEMGLDLERVATDRGLTVEDVIRLHTSNTYVVYAIGFCPGFPYLGYLPPELAGVPRLPSPRLRVEPGSVGLTGRQTGIYPEARPGGWNIVGRTPLEMVNVKAGYFPLRTADRVQFYCVSSAEFRELAGQRLNGKSS